MFTDKHLCSRYAMRSPEARGAPLKWWALLAGYGGWID